MKISSTQLNQYRRQIVRKRIAILGSALLMVVVCLYSIMKGSIDLSLGEVLASLIGRGTRQSNLVILNIRLPRVVTTVLVGAAQLEDEGVEGQGILLQCLGCLTGDILQFLALAGGIQHRHIVGFFIGGHLCNRFHALICLL